MVFNKTITNNRKRVTQTHFHANVIKAMTSDAGNFFFNWDSLYARLNSHYNACSYKKGSTKKITGYRKSV